LDILGNNKAHFINGNYSTYILDHTIQLQVVS
jgi:hypothetical protein